MNTVKSAHPVFRDIARTPSLSEQLLGALLRAIPIRHGKHRLIDRLDRYKRIGGTGWVSVPFGHGSVVVESGDLVGRHFMLLRHFDPEVSDVLVAASRQDKPDTLWDIGANQGTSCYQLVNRLPKLRVVAVEPQVELYELLSQNLNQIASDRFEAYNVGLGSEAQHLELYVPTDNRGAGSLCKEKNEPESNSETVSIVTPRMVLDQSSFGPPDLIKIDVEGYESVVITALADHLRDWSTRVIVFEAHNDSTPEFKSIIETLEGLDFELFRLTKSLYKTLLYPIGDRNHAASDFVALSRSAQRSKALEELIQV
ncbi:MAG: FkbM family methyltransferase [Planctomycetota bacterium]